MKLYSATEDTGVEVCVQTSWGKQTFKGVTEVQSVAAPNGIASHIALSASDGATIASFQIAGLTGWWVKAQEVVEPPCKS